MGHRHLPQDETEYTIVNIWNSISMQHTLTMYLVYLQFRGCGLHFFSKNVILERLDGFDDRAFNML